MRNRNKRVKIKLYHGKKFRYVWGSPSFRLREGTIIGEPDEKNEVKIKAVSRKAKIEIIGKKNLKDLKFK